MEDDCTFETIRRYSKQHILKVLFKPPVYLDHQQLPNSFIIINHLSTKLLTGLKCEVQPI